MRITVTRSTSAPVEAVWDVLTDIPHADRTLGGLLSVEPLSGGPYAPGYRWRETRKVFGVKASAELVVSAAEAPLRTTVLCEEGGTEYVSDFTVSPAGDGPGSGSTLTVVWTSETAHAPAVSRVLMSLMSPLVERSTRRGLEQDLDDIVAEAERRA